MNKFVAICFLAAMAQGIHAQGSDSEYVECAAKRWSVFFSTLTLNFGDKIVVCLEEVEDVNTSLPIIISQSIDARIRSNERYYRRETDSVEKYDKLYRFAAKALEEAENVRKMTSYLREAVDCVTAQVEEITNRFNLTSDCKELRQ